MLYSLISAGLYQLHDKDKGVAAYASKTLLPPEKTAKKALLCTVWAIQRFSNYIGVQKVIIETCHQPITFLNSQWIRDGVVTNARIAPLLMTLQGWDVEAKYAQNYKSSLGNWWLKSLTKLFNGHDVHLSRTERTATTATDKSQLLREECV